MQEKISAIKDIEIDMPQYLKIADNLLRPLMFILGGCSKDSIQETHGWHCKNIDPKTINEKLCLTIEGDCQTRVKNFWNGIHHITILGGRKNYIVLENNQKDNYRFIGRKLENVCQIHRLPIYDKQIKVLKGPKGQSTKFFAFDNKGTQIPLKIIDQGIIGDMKYSKIRLF